jgi:molybdopterin converting factor small subunit
MPVRVHLSSLLRAHSGNIPEFDLEASTVRAALAEIEHTRPALYRSVCDETGAVRRHVNVFVNDTLARDGRGLDTPLKPGDVLTILQAVSGG